MAACVRAWRRGPVQGLREDPVDTSACTGLPHGNTITDSAASRGACARACRTTMLSRRTLLHRVVTLCPRWTGSKMCAGQPRIDDPKDFPRARPSPLACMRYRPIDFLNHRPGARGYALTHAHTLSLTHTLIRHTPSRLTAGNSAFIPEPKAARNHPASPHTHTSHP